MDLHSQQSGVAQIDAHIDFERLRAAVDGITTNLMMADTDLRIVYINPALMRVLERVEADIRKELPRFSTRTLIGQSIDDFHKNPNQQRNLLRELRAPHRARISVGALTFDLTISPSRNDEGKLVGYAVEWFTEQALAQQEVERVLRGAVAGDLTQRIQVERFTGFLRSIGEDMNALIDSVADSFRTVKTATEHIAQAASQLRATSQMMSSAAVEQNKAAEESARALGKTAEGVKANAENASVANQLVSQTADGAQSGKDKMEQMTTAMGEINSAAQQIAKIIKVIDEIAFQTNLLALNAAVEAARAGRHGKGFAVVAQEVRSLAERSAKAAKETASLIEDSVAKVAQGVKIAEGTGSALKEIVQNVAKVVDLVGEIATASGEQAQAIRSVNESMNQVTEGAQAGSQQANEVASAAEELGRQMELLKQRTDKYKVTMPTAATPNGLPAGLTPELMEQVLGLLRAQGMAPPAGHGRPADGGGAPASRSQDPRAVLPLDRDERGFKGF